MLLYKIIQTKNKNVFTIIVFSIGILCSVLSDSLFRKECSAIKWLDKITYLIYLNHPLILIVCETRISIWGGW